MPHKISYDMNISRESCRFPLQKTNDNNTTPVLVVDNSSNQDDIYSEVYASLPNSIKRIYSSVNTNNKTIVKSNTLDVLATDIYDKSVPLFFKHRLKRTDFTQITINEIDHTVFDSNFVYTNIQSGNINYYNDNELIFSERLEPFKVFISDRDIHLVDIVRLDDKYFSFSTNEKEIVIEYSKTVTTKIGTDGSIFKFDVNNKSLNLNGFLYRTDSEDGVFIYDYADYMVDVKTVSELYVNRFDRNKIYLGYSNIIPESIVINVYENTRNLPSIKGRLLYKIVINENVNSYSSDIKFQFEYLVEDGTHVLKEILPEKALNRTDGYIYFSLPEHLSSDDVFMEASFSYADNIAVTVPVLVADILDAYISPTTIINNTTRQYDKNLSIQESFIDTYNFSNGIPQYTFQAISTYGYGEYGFGENLYGGITEDISDEVVVSAENLRPRQVGATGYGLGEYSGGPFGGSLLNVVSELDKAINAKYTYQSNILNIFSASKKKSYDADIYLNHNMSKSINDKYNTLSNYRFNIIHRSLNQETDVIVSAGINKISLKEGIYIPGYKIEDGIIRFDVSSLVDSEIDETTDPGLVDYLRFFNEVGSFNYDLNNLVVFIYNNNSLTPINDNSVEYYLAEEEKAIFVNLGNNYQGAMIGLGLQNDTNILEPKEIFRIWWIS